MPSKDDVLKALVDDALERPELHPDRRSALDKWRDENLTDEERESRKTDAERAAEEQEEADQETGEGRGEGRQDDTAPDSETDRVGPENRPGEDKADTTAPEVGKPSTRKAGK